MPTRRAAILALIGLAGFPHTALAAKSRFASSISRRKAKAEFQRVFRLITEGDFDALYAKGPVEFVVGQKILTEEEIRDFVSDIAAEAIASGQKFFQIDSFERTKSDLRYALFYATVEYRSRVDNYCYPQNGDDGEMPPFCTNEPGHELSIVGWQIQFEGAAIRRLQQTYRIK